MKDGTAPKGGPGNLRQLHPNKQPRRCRTCQAFVSLCLGVPEPAPLPKIAEQLTSSELRARVLAQFALMNGHAPKEKVSK